ncbi:MAG: hypothetical protein KBT01_10265 [Clostridiales bacterium]|nr:hypothetical protein [Candidatus Blautia equi]
MSKEVYWHLPGFCYFRLLNQMTINMMHDYPYAFRDGYKIGSVYGTFPGAIWNGGRVVFGITGKSDMVKILDTYNSKGVPVRFTWTNSLLEEKHTLDTYCNLIMKLADNGMNQVLVNTPVLEKYIRENYPGFKLISSTTKRITDLETLQGELDKDYYLVVLDYDLNHDETVLKSLEPQADRVEILVNEVCYPNCKKRAEHYRQQSALQLEFDVNTPFPCPNQTQPRTFEECKKRPAFISKDDVSKYVERGFVNFKIAARGLPLSYAKDAYIYYLVKDEYQKMIRDKMDALFYQISMAGGNKKK